MEKVTTQLHLNREVKPINAKDPLCPGYPGFCLAFHRTTGNPSRVCPDPASLRYGTTGTLYPRVR